MPQITFEETKYDEIIRLDTKDGWYNGNRMASAELPGYLQVPRGKTGPGIPTLEEEIDAYRAGICRGDISETGRQERTGKSLYPRQRPPTPGPRVRDRPRDTEFARVTTGACPAVSSLKKSPRAAGLIHSLEEVWRRRGHYTIRMVQCTIFCCSPRNLLATQFPKPCLNRYSTRRP